MAEQTQEQPATEPLPALSTEDAAELIARLEQGGEYEPKDEGRSEEEATKAVEEEKRAPVEAKQPRREEPEVEEPDEDAAPVEEPPSSDEESEEKDEPEAEELPSLDPPRSWSKADKEAFRSLPRDSQERILEVEESRSREIRRIQNEAAEKQRAVEAEQKRLAEARQRYEQALPQVESMLFNEMAAKFPEIKTADDVARLASTDVKRWAEFQTLSQKLQAVANDRQAAEQQQQTEARENWKRYADEQDAKFLEAAPEWGEEEKAEKLQKQAIQVLEDIGFTKQEIAAHWTAGIPLSARDHRFQLLLRLAVKQVQGAKAVSQAKAKPKTTVTRPGTSTSKDEVQSAQAEDLKKKLARTGRVDDAVALLTATGRGRM